MSAAVENIASLPHPVSIGGVARPCGVSAPGSVRAVGLLLKEGLNNSARLRDNASP